MHPGNKCNSRLFASYGFSVVDNQDNTAEFRTTLLTPVITPPVTSNPNQSPDQRERNDLSKESESGPNSAVPGVGPLNNPNNPGNHSNPDSRLNSSSNGLLAKQRYLTSVDQNNPNSAHRVRGEEYTYKWAIKADYGI